MYISTCAPGRVCMRERERGEIHEHHLPLSLLPPPCLHYVFFFFSFSHFYFSVPTLHHHSPSPFQQHTSSPCSLVNQIAIRKTPHFHCAAQPRQQVALRSSTVTLAVRAENSENKHRHLNPSSGQNRCCQMLFVEQFNVLRADRR